jgi:hypothetical protein
MSQPFTERPRGAARRPSALILALAVAVVLVDARPAPAQGEPGDRPLFERLVDGVAGLVYWAAWPTATYQRVALKDIAPSRDGAVVTLRLHGKSAFAEGDLWVDVKLAMRRSGEITAMEWGDYNGFFPPGFTWQQIGEAADEINRRNGITPSGRAAAAPPPARYTPPSTPAVELMTVCLSNPTSEAVAYSLKWGDKTEAFTISAGGTRRYWAPAAAGAFDISFDGDLTPAARQVSYQLSGRTSRGDPAACADDITIEFLTEGTRLGVRPKVWAPRSAHPFLPNVVASSTNGSWVCAPGFKWYSPDDKASLLCVDGRYGYVGMSLVVDAGQSFARVAAVTPGSAAAEAGIAVGAFVVSIDGVSTEGLAADAVVAKVRGAAGTTVRVGIAGTGGAPRVVTLTRR